MKRLDNSSNIVEVFSKDGNNLIYAKDFKISNNEFKREIGKFSLYIKDNIKSKYEVQGILPTIKPLKPGLKSARDTNIGVLDIETYFNENVNKSFVYAIGYKVYKGEMKLFYKSNTNNANDLVIECLNSMLVHKYNNYTLLYKLIKLISL